MVAGCDDRRACLDLIQRIGRSDTWSSPPFALLELVFLLNRVASADYPTKGNQDQQE